MLLENRVRGGVPVPIRFVTSYGQYPNEKMNGKLFRIGAIFFRSYHFNVIHINIVRNLYTVIFAELNMD